MDIEGAKSRLEMAQHRLRGCEAHLHRTIQELGIAEASRSDNRLYYRLQRRHGDGYMQIFTDAKDAALREYHSAEEELRVSSMRG